MLLSVRNVNVFGKVCIKGIQWILIFKIIEKERERERLRDEFIKRITSSIVKNGGFRTDAKRLGITQLRYRLILICLSTTVI